MNTNNIINSIKEKFSNMSTNWTIEIIAYLISGLTFGFIFKYIGKYIIGLSIITVLSLWILELYGAITINYNSINSIIGLSNDAQVIDIINQATSWIQTHISHCIAISLGFYLAIELF